MDLHAETANVPFNSNGSDFKIICVEPGDECNLLPKRKAVSRSLQEVQVDRGLANLAPDSSMNGAVESRANGADTIAKGYRPGFIAGQLLNDLWRYTLTRTPYHVHRRKKPVKSRPKINYGTPNDDGEHGLYRWGQEKRDWCRVEAMPRELLAIVDEIERVFGVRPNHAIATYYHNGKDQWIPVHSDKAVSPGSKGGVESQTVVFNLSLGAVRPFVITRLSCLGKTRRKDVDIVAEFPLQSGDLYALDGAVYFFKSKLQFR